jgi:hypothetical protein
MNVPFALAGATLRESDLSKGNLLGRREEKKKKTDLGIKGKKDYRII